MDSRGSQDHRWNPVKVSSSGSAARLPARLPGNIVSVIMVTEMLDLYVETKRRQLAWTVSQVTLCHLALPQPPCRREHPIAFCTSSHIAFV